MTVLMEQPALRKMGGGLGHSAPGGQKFSSPPLFAARVAVLGNTGAHVRFVPGSLAAIMVADGSARATPAGGKVREVFLARPAETHAQRIGAPDGRATGVKFYRSVRLDASASRVFEHHPRCLW
jgi:hypothetical protein